MNEINYMQEVQDRVEKEFDAFKANMHTKTVEEVFYSNYEIHVKMRMPSYDRHIFFELWPHGIEAKYTLRYIPTEVIDQYFEGGLDAAMHRWDVIKTKDDELRELRKRNNT